MERFEATRAGDIVFAPFLLRTRTGELWRGGDAVRLRPKAAAMLEHLARRPGELVSKEDLLRAIWPDVHVQDTALKVCVRELRGILQDSRASPRFIETVSKRGYRFVAPAHLVAGTESAERVAVGRRAHVERLEGAFEAALAGRRPCVFVAGEAGIGKTMLVDMLVGRLGRRALVARGQSIEERGRGEPFLPLVEALERLCRGREGSAVVAHLRQHAPSWLLHLPGLLRPAERARLQGRFGGVPQAHSLRELVTALETLSRDRPVALVLEDLHWADPSTLAALASLARSGAPARLLVVATYRTDAGRAGDVGGALAEMLVRGEAGRIELTGLAVEEVAEYLAVRFAHLEEAQRLATALHRQTDGHPLYLTHAVDGWIAEGLVARGAGGWRLTAPIEQIERSLPETLLEALRAHTADLGEEQTRVLEAASIVGIEFSARAVAAALGETIQRVRRVCEGLERAPRLLRSAGESEWPNRRIGACWQFRHALYRQIFLGRLSRSRRRLLHRRVGNCLEKAYGRQVGEIAGELALHFDEAGAAHRGARYRLLAGQNALGRNAHVEADGHLRRGLDLVEAVPGAAARGALECSLRAALGVTLMSARGFSDPEVEEQYARAMRLCRRPGRAPDQFAVLEGLHSYYATTGALDRAEELARRMLALARRQGARALHLEAEHALGNALLRRGRLAEARARFARGLALYTRRTGLVGIGYCGHDPGVCCASMMGVACLYAGAVDEARRLALAAVLRAERLEHPYSLGMAHQIFAWILLVRGEAAEGLSGAERSLTTANEYGFSQLGFVSALFRAYGLVQVGGASEGVPLAEGLWGMLTATGSETAELASLVANILALGGSSREALAVARAGLIRARSCGPHYLESDLLRLQGEIGLELGSGEGDATACLERARRVARRQGALLLELRSALPLARVWSRAGRRREAADLLRSWRGRLAAGTDVADVHRLEQALEDLG